ncbi:MAG: hypothetical protein AAGJ28_05850 [Pseudomonadota bacterium]
MSMLIEEMQSLASNPGAWIVVLVMAGIGAVSLMELLACPVARGRHTPSDEDVRAAKEKGFQAGWRFGLMMLTGGVLTTAGLFMIAYGIKPAFGLGAVVLGILLVQTEPHRLQIREGRRMVIAAHHDGDAVLDGARDRLRSGQMALAVSNIVLLLALVAGLMAFK